MWPFVHVRSVARDLLHQFLYATDSLLKVAHLDDAKSAVVNETYIAVSRLSMLYNTLSLYTSSVLVGLNFSSIHFSVFGGMRNVIFPCCHSENMK